MTAALPIEVYLSLAFLSAAIALSALAFANLFSWPWEDTMTGEKGKEATAGIFILMAAFEMPGILAFLAGLLLLFAAPQTSDAAAQTLGVSAEAATTLHLGVGLASAALVGLLALRMLRLHASADSKVLSVIISVFVGSLGLYALLLLALVSVAPTWRAEGGYVDGAFLVFLGSLVSLAASVPTKSWMRDALEAKTFNKATWEGAPLLRRLAPLAVVLAFMGMGISLILT